MALEEFKDSLVFRCALFVFISLTLAFTSACDKDLEVYIENSKETIIISPDDYRIVSNSQKELLSCGPVSIVDEEGRMTVAYLADEESCVESEFSSSIFLRVSRFNIYDNLLTCGE